MRTCWRVLVAAMLAMLVAACGDGPAEPGDPIDDPEVSTKEQAASFYQENGKADALGRPRRDFCQRLGWYGDGICDDFCPKPDPDCEPPASKTCGTIAGLTCGAGEYCDYGVGQCQVADASGVCKATPQACTRQYAPVCGCDGKTYGNPCEAAAAGMSVDHQGECKPAPTQVACGGWLGDTCQPGEYCEFGKTDDHICDWADASGICTPRPQACTEEYAPVCGCDGQTYSNECSANAAGIDAVSSGACRPANCPDPNDPNVTYVSNSDKDPSVCQSIRFTCPAGEKPFSDACGCGCIKESKPEPKTCGTIAGLTCGAGEYCDYGVGQCQVSDASGVCKPKTEVCTDQYDPVCGCDGKTYGNACNAAGAGVSVDHQGECKKSSCPDPNDPNVTYVSNSDKDPGICKTILFRCPDGEKLFSDACGCGCIKEPKPAPVACGARLGNTCQPGEYCEFGKTDAHICDWADATGVCTPRPQACTRDYRPVCGCDGQTYSNECSANAAGIDAVSSGACAP